MKTNYFQLTGLIKNAKAKERENLSILVEKKIIDQESSKIILNIFYD